MSFLRGMHPLALAALAFLGALCGGMAEAVDESVRVGMPGKIILSGLCAALLIGGSWAIVSIGRRRA